jgi:hypothetical protein
VIAGSGDDLMAIAKSMRSGTLPPQFVLRVYVGGTAAPTNTLPGVTIRSLGGAIDDPLAIEGIERLA